ncbi:hypothetical protein Tco_0768620 [Tanacetum coccineum]
MKDDQISQEKCITSSFNLGGDTPYSIMFGPDISKNKTGVYWDSICDHHKSEISYVVLCNVHDKRISRDSADNVHPASPIGRPTKIEKNIFVDESLDSRGSSNIGKNQVASSSDY